MGVTMNLYQLKQQIAAMQRAVASLQYAVAKRQTRGAGK